MRRVSLILTTLACLIAAAVVSRGRQPAAVEATTTANQKFQVAVEDKNPWTSLTPNVAPDQFQFAIVSDRTGGHRKGVFSKAVQQVNLMQPEFVMSVGDLIEGALVPSANVAQWEEFDKYAKQFQMPFFYCAGNHDSGTAAKDGVWKNRWGRFYYHFVYQNCLFLVLNSNDGPAKGPRVAIGPQQLEYIKKALADTPNVRWTFVFLHHPVWTARDLTENGWLEVEKALAGRKHNIFCGHVHVFRKFFRNGTSYYQLATTGGGSALRGTEYGEFDQIAWVTMKQNGPVIAQIGLNGVMKDDLSEIETDEPGLVNKSVEGLSEVVGTVTLNGQPAKELQVQFWEIGAAPPAPPPAAGRPSPPTGSGIILPDGSFRVYAFRSSPGLKPGRYAVTFAPAPSLVIDNKDKPNPIPEKYRAVNTTPYRVEVKPDVRNKFDFQLEAE